MMVSAAMILLFLGLGTFFITGRGASLIAGYNTMSVEEQEKYDKLRLCKFMGKTMYALSFSMVFWVLSDFLDKPWLLYMGLVFFLGIILFMIIYMNTGNRFQKTQ